MSSSLMPFVIVIVVACIIAVVFYTAKIERERVDALAALAKRHGWTCDPEGDPLWISTFTHSPFEQGHNRRLGATLTGIDRDRRIAVFDYVYDTTETSTTSNGNGGTNTTSREQAHHFRVAVVATGLLGAVVSLENENWLVRAFDALTGGDIDFESEDFNRRFRVQCSNRKFAYDVITAPLMEALLVMRPERLVWEAGWLMWADRGSWSAGEIEPTLTNLHSLVDLIPEYLLEPGTPPSGPKF